MEEDRNPSEGKRRRERDDKPDIALPTKKRIKMAHITQDLDTSDERWAGVEEQKELLLRDIKAQHSARAHELLGKVIPSKIIALDQLWQRFSVVIGGVKESDRIQDSSSAQERRGETKEKEKEKEKEAETEKGNEYEGLSEEDRRLAMAHKFKYPANTEMTKLVELLRQEIADLMEIGTTLHAWVRLSIPGRGREERAFEAAVQEEMSQEMGVVKASGQILIQSILAFLLRRALLVEEVGKHQEVEDYHLSVPQMDMEQLVSVKRWIRDCRSMYQLILDLVSKNLGEMTRREKAKLETEAHEKKTGGEGEDKDSQEDGEVDTSTEADKSNAENEEDEAIIRRFQQRLRRTPTPTRRMYRTTSRGQLN